MKSFIAALIIAVIIIGGGILFTSQINKLSEQLIKINDEISQTVDYGDYSAAEEQVEKLSEFIDNKKVLLGSCVDHAELDKIEMNLSKLEVYIKEEEREDSLAFSNTLKMLFEHLPKNYKIKLENIL